MVNVELKNVESDPSKCDGVVAAAERRHLSSPSKPWGWSSDVTGRCRIRREPSPSGRGQGEGSDVTLTSAVVGPEARNADITTSRSSLLPSAFCLLPSHSLPTQHVPATP